MANIAKKPWEKFFGTWKLDVGKSSYAVSEVPKQATLLVEKDRGGLAFKLEWVDFESKEGVLEHGLVFDEPVMVNGHEITLSVAEDGALATVVKRDGEVIARTRRTLSADGAVMEYTQTGVLPDKKEYVNRSVFTRA